MTVRAVTDNLDLSLDAWSFMTEPDDSGHGIVDELGDGASQVAAMSDADAADFLSSYGLTESGLSRLIRKSYELLGLISFFTVGEDECRAWTTEREIAEVLQGS